MKDRMGLKIYDIALKKFYGGLDSLIENKCLENKYVIMFGSSLVAGMVMSYLEMKGIIVDAIIDNDKTRENTRISNIKISSPEKFRDEFRTDAVFLIFSFWQEEMINQLKSYGYQVDRHILKIMDYGTLLNDYSFADREHYKRMSLKEVRESQAGILNYLDKVCREHSIRYFLAYGTLLGAVRHKGFIPWDDDVDVLIELKDFKRLCEILKNDNDYAVISSINTPGFFEQYSLMVDQHTVSDINTFPTQITTGVSIDIYPLCGLPEDEEQYQEYVKKLKQLEQERCNKMYSEAECKKVCDQIINYMSQYDYDECTYAGCLLSPYYLKEKVKKEVYGKGRTVFFEGMELTAPDNWDFLLKKIYGDYMTLPPKEQREGHHFYKAYFDLV